MSGVTDWLRDVTGCQSVHVGEQLSGATTATVQSCLAIRADGSVDPLIVKIYDQGIEGVGPDDVSRDAAAMVAAAEVGVRAPMLVDADAAGDRLGWPAIVMTRLHGVPRGAGGSDPAAWVAGLADELALISAAPMPHRPLPSWEPWFDLPLEAPTWASDPGLWRDMETVVSEPLPHDRLRFIHRDFHPLNVLWDGATVSGTVDWVNGCIGPIESDVASCRLNIAVGDRSLDGWALADDFLARCVDRGVPWHPAWDLDMIAGLSRPDGLIANADAGANLTVESIRATYEAGIRLALAALA
ncbi:MAG: aminoglycoside phosphotransferase family protein [Actinomycetota bacterium]